MAFLVTAIFSILLSLSIFLFLSQEPSKIEKRIKRTQKKQTSSLESLLSLFNEYIAPLSKRNLTSKHGKELIRVLLLQSGQDSSEENIVAFESKRIFYTFLTFGLCLILCILFKSHLIALSISLMLIYITYATPTFMLKIQIDKRQKDLIKNLPDAIDLLAICLQAGLGLDASLARIANEFALTSKVIAQEFLRLNKDILSGIPRQEAYRNLVLRNPNKELKSFIALLIQSDKLGTSITLSLKAYCESVRTRKKQRIEELSQQASAKMTIPMVLFMLPAIFIIILYPSVIKIMETNTPF